MKAGLILTSILFLLTFTTSQAQVRVKKGDIKVLKGQKMVAVKFTYEKMGVGKFKNEKDYLDKKVAEYNKKEAGRGDEWRKSWEGDRTNRFQPQFLKLINKYTEKQGASFEEDVDDAKYTMIVNTDFTEPGFNVVVMQRFAEIRTTVTIVETANPDKVVAVLSAAGVGRTFGNGDLDTGVRIAEAYAKTGKELGKYLSKKALK